MEKAQEERVRSAVNSWSRAPRPSALRGRRIAACVGSRCSGCGSGVQSRLFFLNDCAVPCGGLCLYLPGSNLRAGQSAETVDAGKKPLAGFPVDPGSWVSQTSLPIGAKENILDPFVGRDEFGFRESVGEGDARRSHARERKDGLAESEEGRFNCRDNSRGGDVSVAGTGGANVGHPTDGRVCGRCRFGRDSGEDFGGCRFGSRTSTCIAVSNFASSACIGDAIDGNVIGGDDWGSVTAGNVNVSSWPVCHSFYSIGSASARATAASAQALERSPAAAASDTFSRRRSSTPHARSATA